MGASGRAALSGLAARRHSWDADAAGWKVGRQSPRMAIVIGLVVMHVLGCGAGDESSDDAAFVEAVNKETAAIAALSSAVDSLEEERRDIAEGIVELEAVLEGVDAALDEYTAAEEAEAPARRALDQAIARYEANPDDLGVRKTLVEAADAARVRSEFVQARAEALRDVLTAQYTEQSLSPRGDVSPSASMTRMTREEACAELQANKAKKAQIEARLQAIDAEQKKLLSDYAALTKKLDKAQEDVKAARARAQNAADRYRGAVARLNDAKTTADKTKAQAAVDKALVAWNKAEEAIAPAEAELASLQEQREELSRRAAALAVELARLQGLLEALKAGQPPLEAACNSGGEGHGS